MATYVANNATRDTVTLVLSKSHDNPVIIEAYRKGTDQ